VFTARYALSPYIKQIRFVFKGLRRFGGRAQLGVRLIGLWWNSNRIQKYCFTSLFAPCVFTEMAPRKLPTTMHYLISNKSCYRSSQLRHVSVAATTAIRESFYTASWNTAGIKQSPSCYACAAKVHFTPSICMSTVLYVVTLLPPLSRCCKYVV
jgi:hypothetical protein